ncbi:MAG TPA: DUF5701 family protein [Mycobacteriales bacterium]
MTRPVSIRPTNRLTELRRQTEVLVDRGYPELAGLDPGAFRALVARLAIRLPDERFVLVVSGALVPCHRMVEHIALGGRPGFTTMDADDLARFQAIPDLVRPSSPVYLVVDVDTGGDTRNVRPDDALPGITAAGRTPLTVEEGLAVVTQFPEWLRERNCFQMLGSRAGDRRVTGLWVSRGAPRLGWCWAGNPHSWLGMASAARRVG